MSIMTQPMELAPMESQEFEYDLSDIEVKVSMVAAGMGRRALETAVHIYEGALQAAREQFASPEEIADHERSLAINRRALLLAREE